MIGRLRGRLQGGELDGECVLEVGGVGYELTVPLGTRRRCLHDPAGEVVLHVHTHVRAESLELFGFATERERKVFRLLLAVPNVGPRTALAVLSSLSADELSAAVARSDVARLAKVPGVGKKTAERLVLELKERLGGALGEVADGSEATDAPAGRAMVLQALVGLGYKAGEAERALQSLGRRPPEESPEALLKEALRKLS